MDPAETSEDSEFNNFAAQSHIFNNSAEGGGEDPAESPATEDHSSCSDAYIPRDYDDDGSEPGSFVHIEDLDKELGRWKVPPEPLRPANPYKKGQIMEIRKHTACPPFGADYPYYEGVPEYTSERHLRGTTLVELCLDHPAPKGGTATDQEPQTLEILKEIRAGDESGAQIVVCQFSASQEEVVAKIYDPLYYGFAHRMWSDQPRDVTYEAHMDYCREVAAYSELDGALGGKEIPQYYGSWTFQLPLEIPGRKPAMRDIRLVLMEYIQGTQMTYLSPESVPESVGMEIVTRLVEARAKIQFAGVKHGDISQRNIMVCLAEPHRVTRVAFVDFNYAVVHRLADYEQRFPGFDRRPKSNRRQKSNKLPNPIDVWWGGALYGVVGEWLPKSWEMRLRACQEWLYERYGNSEDYEHPGRLLHWDEENLPRIWIAI
ncbi:hypothetical protein SLS63_010052 [Diaporthe eres]|uniref:Non-specific serine/threonine protein kinase n=1 Tax=Diaporthe eres TaxID=83184 RepID=A0ABR1NY26_DIAER